MHEKHKGHDAMHAEMLIILLVTLIVAQVALFEWKKRHYRSYSVSPHEQTNFAKKMKIFNFNEISNAHFFANN